MTFHLSDLAAKIYKHLLAQKDRAVPFEELCLFVQPYSSRRQLSNERFPTPVSCQSLVMESLLFLSDIDLIILNELTDQSSLNLAGRN